MCFQSPRRRGENEAKKIFKEIMAGSFPTFEKGIYLQVQETQ